MVKKDVIRSIKSWEAKNLAWGSGYYYKKTSRSAYHKSLSSQVAPTGADIMRISPSITKKFGLKYRKVLVGYLDPERKTTMMGKRKVSVPKRDRLGKIIAKAPRWYTYGYIKAGKRRGTFKLHSLISFSKGSLRKLGL